MKKSIAISVFTLLFCFVSYAQKPKKTHNHEKFVKKVKFAFTPDLIVKWMPDQKAIQYISEKTGRSIDELQAENEANTENVKKNIQYFLDNNVAFILDKTEVKVKEEGPVKIADILLYCSFRKNNFIIKLSNCVQTNLSWYLGDEIIPEGDGFDNFISYKKSKKPGKLLTALKKIEEKQAVAAAESKRQEAYADSLRALRPGYEARLFPMKNIDQSSKYYQHHLTNMPLKGYYITNKGDVVDAVIAYQKPEFLVGDAASAMSLFICKAANGKVVDVLNPNLEPNFKEHINKNNVRAFFVGGQLYANIPAVGWRIVINEGAIHTFALIVKMNENKYVAYEQTQKLNGVPIGSVLGKASANVRVDMMADSPEIVQEYRDGIKTIYEAEIKFNIWYDLMYPERVSYLPVPKDR